MLALLYRRLSTARMAALIQPQARYGLGGIGKTQTAAEFAFRYGDDYTHVFWMWAVSRDTLTADFVALAALLNLPEKDEQDQARIVAAVKRWLAANEGWLLILDNADDLPMAQEFVPTNHKGYILFTTRAQAAGSIAASVEVEKMTLQEGTLLLLRQAKLLDKDTPLEQAQTADRAAAERIVRRWMGCRWQSSRLAHTWRRQAAAWTITSVSTRRTVKSYLRGAVTSSSTILKQWLLPGCSRFSRSSRPTPLPPICCASTHFSLPIPSLKACQEKSYAKRYSIVV